MRVGLIRVPKVGLLQSFACALLITETLNYSRIPHSKFSHFSLSCVQFQKEILLCSGKVPFCLLTPSSLTANEVPKGIDIIGNGGIGVARRHDGCF